jgi:hypothetical protein
MRTPPIQQNAIDVPADATDRTGHEQHSHNGDRIQFQAGLGAGLLLRRCKGPRSSGRKRPCICIREITDEPVPVCTKVTPQLA